MNFDELLGPSHRVYAPFVAVSLLLAAFTWWRAGRARKAAPRPSLLRYLFPRRLFWHRSSRLDLAWLGVRALVSWPLRFSVLGVALVVCGAIRDRAGLSPTADWSAHVRDRTAIFVLFAIVLFLADDFTRWALHRLMHAVPALWELHKVHHSAEVLTPITLYRVHPLESAANQLRGGFATGFVTGLFMYLFPGTLRSYEVLGVDLLGFLWTTAGANLRHSHVWLAFPAFVERWLISPAQHQLHHARSGPHGNYGSALSVWDRAFGSLIFSAGRKAPRIGLPRAERNHELTVWSALVAPVAAAVSRSIPFRSTPCRSRSADSPTYE